MKMTIFNDDYVVDDDDHGHFDDKRISIRSLAIIFLIELKEVQGCVIKCA